MYGSVALLSGLDNVGEIPVDVTYGGYDGPSAPVNRIGRDPWFAKFASFHPRRYGDVMIGKVTGSGVVRAGAQTPGGAYGAFSGFGTDPHNAGYGTYGDYSVPMRAEKTFLSGLMGLGRSHTVAAVVHPHGGHGGGHHKTGRTAHGHAKKKGLSGEQYVGYYSPGLAGPGYAYNPPSSLDIFPFGYPRPGVAVGDVDEVEGIVKTGNFQTHQSSRVEYGRFAGLDGGLGTVTLPLVGTISTGTLAVGIAAVGAALYFAKKKKKLI
jgi:hypothetical protein